MTVAARTALVVWEGTFRVGKGIIHPASGAFDDLPVSFAERLESASDATSPEELMASAHAACYAMSLSNTLSANGNQPERLEVTAACELDRIEGGLAIRQVRLDVKGVVPRVDPQEFAMLAEKAEKKCVISNALRGNVEIQVSAELLPGPRGAAIGPGQEVNHDPTGHEDTE